MVGFGGTPFALAMENDQSGVRDEIDEADQTLTRTTADAAAAAAEECVADRDADAAVERAATEERVSRGNTLNTLPLSACEGAVARACSLDDMILSTNRVLLSEYGLTPADILQVEHPEDIEVSVSPSAVIPRENLDVSLNPVAVRVEGSLVPDYGDGMETASEETPRPQRIKRKAANIASPSPKDRLVSDEEDNEVLFRPRTQTARRRLVSSRDDSDVKEAPISISSGEDEEDSRRISGVLPLSKRRRRVTPRKRKAGREPAADGLGGEPAALLNTSSGVCATATRGKPGGRGGSKRNVKSSSEESPPGVGPEDLRMLTATDLGACIDECLDDMENIRYRSKSLQGKLSGELKQDILWMRQAVVTLTGKAVSSGDPALLNRRNTELSARLRASEKEVRQACEETVHVRRDLEEARIELERARKSASVSDGGGALTAPVKDDAINAIKANSYAQIAKVDPRFLAVRRSATPDRRPRAPSDVPDDKVMVAASAAIDPGSDFFEGGSLKNLREYAKDKEDYLSGRIAALMDVRREMRRVAKLLEDRVEDPVLPPASSATSLAPPTSVSGKRGPRIVRNVQLVAQPNDASSTGQPSAVEVDNDGWVITATGARRRKAKSRGKLSIAVGDASVTSEVPTPMRGVVAAPSRTNDVRAESVKPPVRRRAPRSAAVAVRCNSESVSYAEVLRVAREKISFVDMDIFATKIRRSFNGGVLIEISGADGSSKADSLALQLKSVVSEIYGDSVSVSRPVAKGELRIIGLDDSVTEEEIRCAIADSGACSLDAIKIGPLRRLGSGMLSAWAQCPLTAALAVSAEGKLRIGWSVARVELLEARPIQCFRCWQFGHMSGSCRASVNRGQCCFRCGEEGHMARNCVAPVCCIVCKERGLEHAHRMGSAQCSSCDNRVRRPVSDNAR